MSEIDKYIGSKGIQSIQDLQNTKGSSDFISSIHNNLKDLFIDELYKTRVINPLKSYLLNNSPSRLVDITQDFANKLGIQKKDIFSLQIKTADGNTLTGKSKKEKKTLIENVRLDQLQESVLYVTYAARIGKGPTYQGDGTAHTDYKIVRFGIGMVNGKTAITRGTNSYWFEETDDEYKKIVEGMGNVFLGSFSDYTYYGGYGGHPSPYSFSSGSYSDKIGESGFGGDGPR